MTKTPDSQSDFIPLSQQKNPTGRLYRHVDDQGNVHFSEQPIYTDATDTTNHAETTSTDPPNPHTFTTSMPKRSWIPHIILIFLLIGTLTLAYIGWRQLIDIEQEIPFNSSNIVENRSQTLALSTQPKEVTKSEVESFEKRMETLTITQGNLVKQFNTLAKQLPKISELEQRIENLSQKLQENQILINNTIPEKLNERMDFLDAQLARVEGLEQEFAALSQRLPKEKIDWELAEIRYLLTLANYRLQLINDAQGGLTILNAAYERLHQFEKQKIARKIQTQLAKDIKQLREAVAHHPQITKLAHQITLHSKQVEELPLQQGYVQRDQDEDKINKADLSLTPPADNTDSDVDSWQQALQVFWMQSKQLVTIRYNDQTETGLLSYNQRYLIMQNLRLRLESIRLCLLRQDRENFLQSIESALQWLKQYYDQNNLKVLKLQNDLQNMQDITLAPTLPDMTDTIKLLDRLAVIIPVANN